MPVEPNTRSHARLSLLNQARRVAQVTTPPLTATAAQRAVADKKLALK
jgi:hypothetical protein